MTNIIEIQKEIKQELANKAVMEALVTTTFKGLETKNVFLAIQEGMMRGFVFKDFLEKNIYAIPFGGGYSLVTSIDYARKVGMKNGVVGVSAPTYEEDINKKIVSCTITVKRKVGEYIGEYSATVYFDEYNTKRNQWVSKPRTMIAKVAEMHALRKACPEELSQAYSEEEKEKDVEPAVVIDVTTHKAKLEAVKDLKELKTVWASLPVEAKKDLADLKEELKKKYANA